MITREQFREIKRLNYQQFFEVIERAFEREKEKFRSHYYYDAWTSAFMALVKEYPNTMDADHLHTLAVDTLKEVNSGAVPSERAQWLLENVGFDIYEAPSQSFLNYLEDKGGL